MLDKINLVNAFIFVSLRRKLMAKQLQRELNNRHIQLIAIGGAIGTGLF